MDVLGIDLAAQPRRTGVVVLSGGHDNLADTIGPTGPISPFGPPTGRRWVAAVPDDQASDRFLIQAGARADLVGVDAPLGWPTAFVAAVVEHQRFGQWPGTEDRRPLTHRLTDDVVVQEGWGRPMSTSADKLGSVAMRCTLLQREWATAWGAPAPRDGSGRLAEVYPAAALRAWNLPSAGYKASGQARSGGARPDGPGPHGAAAVRSRLMELVAARTATWLDLTPVIDACIGSDHVFDALVSALVSVAVLSGSTSRPRTPAESESGRVEGWIHVPVVALDDLVPPESPDDRSVSCAWWMHDPPGSRSRRG